MEGGNGMSCLQHKKEREDGSQTVCFSLMKRKMWRMWGRRTSCQNRRRRRERKKKDDEKWRLDTKERGKSPRASPLFLVLLSAACCAVSAFVVLLLVLLLCLWVFSRFSSVGPDFLALFWSLLSTCLCFFLFFLARPHQQHTQAHIQTQKEKEKEKKEREDGETYSGHE